MHCNQNVFYYILRNISLFELRYCCAVNLNILMLHFMFVCNNFFDKSCSICVPFLFLLNPSKNAATTVSFLGVLS